MEREETNKLNFTIALISEFATRYGIKQRQAFNYLHRFKGMEFLNKYYNTMHTQSFDDVIDDLIGVCHNNGGLLA